MPKYEIATIADQVTVTRARSLEVRFAIVALTDGAESGCHYHRTIIDPGTDPSRTVWIINRHFEQSFTGVPLLDGEIERYLQAIAARAHTPEVVTRFGDVCRRMIPALDSEHALVSASQRDWLGVATPDFAASKDIVRASIVNRVVIDRARVERVNFGLVICHGGMEIFNALHEARLPPGGDAHQLRRAMTSEIAAQFGHPPVKLAHTQMVDGLTADIHSPLVVEHYESAYRRWHDRVIAQGFDPTTRTPEIDQTDGLVIAGAKPRTIGEITTPRSNNGSGHEDQSVPRR